GPGERDRRGPSRLADHAVVGGGEGDAPLVQEGVRGVVVGVEWYRGRQRRSLARVRARGVLVQPRPVDVEAELPGAERPAVPPGGLAAPERGAVVLEPLTLQVDAHGRLEACPRRQ